ncbi:MAG: alkaline phosphatase family protein [Planctomycetaceae bacterium]|nr:alkaline phosphatase family protein [Planctomycetaceae bacterium]
MQNLYIRHRHAVTALLVLLAIGQVTVGAADPADRQTENVVLITFDGFRWQEMFTGADESFINKEFGGVREIEATRDAYWRPTAEERRATLLPFFWSTIATQGQLYGNPEQESVSRVTNGHNFSYPGYSEILIGYADPWADSNDKRPNPNVTVLEWLNNQPACHGRVAAFTSWDVFPFIINEERSGIPVNAGWEPLPREPAGESLNLIAAELPHVWAGVRYDYFTFRGAEECLKHDQPRVLYVSFGETDDWAHGRRYDLYLESAQRTDHYVRRLWELVQSLPQYAGKTSFVLTTDHGRGETRENWISHGDEHAGSDQMWIAVLGPDTDGGPVPAGTVTQSQVAATVAALLGEDYNAAVPQAAQPLPGAIRSE